MLCSCGFADYFSVHCPHRRGMTCCVTLQLITAKCPICIDPNAGALKISSALYVWGRIKELKLQHRAKSHVSVILPATAILKALKIIKMRSRCLFHRNYSWQNSLMRYLTSKKKKGKIWRSWDFSVITVVVFSFRNHNPVPQTDSPLLEIWSVSYALSCCCTFIPASRAGD